MRHFSQGDALLFASVCIPLMAQVSSMAFSDSKDVIPAFDSSGAITLPAARLKVDVAYPKGKKERCELTVVYDLKTGHYLWHRLEPNHRDDKSAISAVRQRPRSHRYQYRVV